MTLRIVIWCDHEGCKREAVSDHAGVTPAMAKRDGWLKTGPRHYCWEHHSKPKDVAEESWK